MCVCVQLESGEWVEDEEQTVKLKTDFIISAFGSQLQDQGSESFIHIHSVSLFSFSHSTTKMSMIGFFFLIFPSNSTLSGRLSQTVSYLLLRLISPLSH